MCDVIGKVHWMNSLADSNRAKLSRAYSRAKVYIFLYFVFCSLLDMSLVNESIEQKQRMHIIKLNWKYWNECKNRAAMD